MLNNIKLNRRIRKIFKMLNEKWGISIYRIAVETEIPHSSLKYMMDERFEWKLNHLLSIIDFLNRNSVKISLKDLLDFENNKPLSQIMNADKADFREVASGLKEGYRRRLNTGQNTAKQRNFQMETEGLLREITDVIRESPLMPLNKISVGVKISGKNFEFHNDLNFLKGKLIKS